jgi:hypothetical protein
VLDVCDGALELRHCRSVPTHALLHDRHNRSTAACGDSRFMHRIHVFRQQRHRSNLLSELRVFFNLSYMLVLYVCHSLSVCTLAADVESSSPIASSA